VEIWWGSALFNLIMDVLMGVFHIHHVGWLWTLGFEFDGFKSALDSVELFLEIIHLVSKCTEGFAGLVDSVDGVGDIVAHELDIMFEALWTGVGQGSAKVLDLVEKLLNDCLLGLLGDGRNALVVVQVFGGEYENRSGSSMSLVVKEGKRVLVPILAFSGRPLDERSVACFSSERRTTAALNLPVLKEGTKVIF
jgi:hypothetical protein